MARKKGELIEGSKQHWLCSFDLGEVRRVETTLSGYAHDQREINLPKARRVPALVDRAFQTGLFTAVSSSKAGSIAFLLRVERTK